MIRKKPHLPEFLILRQCASSEVVRAPIDDHLGRLTLTADPKFNITVLEFIPHSGAKSHTHLEGHPLVWLVLETVAVRWEVAG